MNKYDIYIIVIFIVKIIFILLALLHVYLKTKGNQKSNLDKKIQYWKERFEFVFILLMSFLLIYLFNPTTDKSILIDKETKILLYLFGFVLLITANWDIFIQESMVFKKMKQ
jgi:hypothetical protein